MLNLLSRLLTRSPTPAGNMPRRYAVAVACAAQATLLRFLLDPLLGDDYPFIVGLVAAVLVAWYAGFRPALLTLTLAALASVYCFVPPRQSFLIAGVGDGLGLALYFFAGLTAARLIESRQGALRQAEAATEEALAGQRELEGEARQREQAQEELRALNATLEQRVAERTAVAERRAEELTRLNVRLGQEIAERRRAEEDIRRYEDIVQSVPIGLTIWHLEDFGDNHSLRLAAVNPAASRLLGVDVGACLGLLIREAFPAVAAADVRRYADVVRSGNPDDLGELHYGDERVAANYWAVKAFPLPGRCVGIAFENVTARRRAEDAVRRLNQDLERRVAERTAELTEAVRDLEEKNRENEMFVYSVSHDLRSPLVNLQGFSKELGLACQDLRELLNQDGVPPDVRRRGLALLDQDVAEAVRFILTGVTRLGTIIDALLRLSRAGRVEYQAQPVDVRAVATRVVESLRATIDERGAAVTVGALPPAWGDPAALEQVFANLIGNALTYLDPQRPGRVEVGSRNGAGDGAAGDCQTYYVKDNGLGIAAAYQHKVFQVFQRVHPEVAHGEGMGLAIVRRVVERHRGKVWVESQPGEGSTFFVSLPEAQEQSAPGECPRRERAYVPQGRAMP